METTNSDRWNVLSGDWTEQDSFILFGFGATARVYIDALIEKIKVEYIIDNSEELKESEYKGIRIVKFDEIKDRIAGRKIVILAETIAQSRISAYLRDRGLKENEDYTFLEIFICEWFLRKYKKIFLMEVHMAVTTMCTFNCRNCNMFIPYYKSPNRSFSFEYLTENIDALMKHVDYLFKLQIVGGEPFLNKDLSKFLRYLKDKYIDKIGFIRIISNGSIVPDDSLIAALKALQSEVMISDYTGVIEYSSRYNETVEKLRVNGVKHKENKALLWRDFKFPEASLRLQDNEVRLHTYLCGTAWHGIADKKLYYCNTAWSAQESGLYSCSKNDYIDLDGDNSGVDILKLCLGLFDDDTYHSFCRVCGGCGEDNTEFVPVAEQL